MVALACTAVPVAIVLGFVIAAALRPSKPGRHKGSYIPPKDRPVISGATDHNATWEGVGSRSKRFPELERTSSKTSPDPGVPGNPQQPKPEA